MSEIRFTLNGSEHVARDVDPHVTLLHYLRRIELTGCKEGCAEGECGACAVALVARGPKGETRYEAVNACLVLLPTMHGRELVTVEGVARGETLHPVQRCMAEGGGSQCGYCTPGFVVSLFAEYYRAESGPLDEEAIAGNLCRCTGYRPIRDAATALVSIRTQEIARREVDGARIRLTNAVPAMGQIQERGFQRPASLREACRLHRDHPELVLLGGGTDVVVEVNQRHRRYPGFLSLEAVPEMNVIDESADAITIGASVSLAHVEERLHGRLRLFDELLPLFSSRLIRSRATLGGNLGTASPIGDSPPALLALDAEIVVARADANDALESRRVPIERFFLDYRKTALAADELIVAVRIPAPFARVQRFYKVSKRRADDISTVAAAFALDLDARGTVTKARLAFGGVAATPKRALAAEAALVGKLPTAATFATAARIAESEFTPMDDHRGTARYRSAMVRSLVERFFVDAFGDETSNASTQARGGA